MAKRAGLIGLILIIVGLIMVLYGFFMRSLLGFPFILWGGLIGGLGAFILRNVLLRWIWD